MDIIEIWYFQVTTDGLNVVFFEDTNRVESWSANALNVNIFRQVAIVFDVPPYRDPSHGTNATVFIPLAP